MELTTSPIQFHNQTERSDHKRIEGSAGRTEAIPVYQYGLRTTLTFFVANVAKEGCSPVEGYYEMI